MFDCACLYWACVFELCTVYVCRVCVGMSVHMHVCVCE